MNYNEKLIELGNSNVLDKIYYTFILLMITTNIVVFGIRKPVTRREHTRRGNIADSTSEFWLFWMFIRMVFVTLKVLFKRYNEIVNNVEPSSK